MVDTPPARRRSRGWSGSSYYTLEGAEVSTLWRVARRRRSGWCVDNGHVDDTRARSSCWAGWMTSVAVLKLKQGAVRERLVPLKRRCRASTRGALHTADVSISKC